MRINDLIHIYESKPDEELLLLAKKLSDLTDEARAALTGELMRRRLIYGNDVLQQKDPPVKEAQWQAKVRPFASQNYSSIGEFISEVTRLYRANFWLFVKLVAPAVVLGYFTIMFGRSEGRRIASHFPRGVELLQHRVEIFQIWIVNLGAGFLSWAVFCLSFGAICLAVACITTERAPTTSECFAGLSRRPGRLAAVSIVLYVLFLVAMGLSMLLMTVLFWFFARQIPSYAILWISYAFTALALLLLTRFGLALPAVVLDECTVGQSLFRSDELTERKWSVLAALLAKSVVGGYVAGMLPFWVAGWVWTYVQVPIWSLTALSIAGVILVEPFMFIGFSLLYIKGTGSRFRSHSLLS